MNALGVLTLASVAAAPVIVLSPVKGRAPVRPALKYAIPAALATLIAVPLSIKVMGPLCLIAAIAPALIARPKAKRYANVTYPRAVTTRLLAGRLKALIGDKWTARALRVTYSGADTADHDAITSVEVKLPRNILPSKVSDDCKKVIAETVGSQWTSSTKETVMTFKPKVVEEDPPALKYLKSVLLDQSALGTDGDVKVLKWNEDDGTILEFIGYASKKLGNIVASETRQAAIKKLVRTRVPIENGSWVMNFDVTETPTMHAYRSAFRKIIEKPVPELFITSREEAAERYPDAVCEIGVAPDGRVHTRTFIDEPNGVISGAPGKGKTTHLHTMIAEASRWGFMIIIIDGKFSDSFIGFRDWPGVVTVANDVLSAVRALFFVDELLAERQSGGRTGEYPIDENIGVYVIIDEYPFLMTSVEAMWQQLKDPDDKSANPVKQIAENLNQMVRQFRIHIDMVAQKPDGKRISENIVFNSDKKSQWGQMTGAQSNAYWGDFHTGLSVPPLRGRGLIKTIEGDPEEIQGYYIPDPNKIKTEHQLELLAQQMPPVSLYRRIVFAIPDPMKSEWYEMVSAPWSFVEDRPDLDPMSPLYDPPVFMRYRTFKNLNPATLDVDGDSTAATANAPEDDEPQDTPVDLDELDDEDSDEDEESYQ